MINQLNQFDIEFLRLGTSQSIQVLMPQFAMLSQFFFCPRFGFVILLRSPASGFCHRTVTDSSLDNKRNNKRASGGALFVQEVR